MRSLQQWNLFHAAGSCAQDSPALTGLRAPACILCCGSVSLESLPSLNASLDGRPPDAARPLSPAAEPGMTAGDGA